MVKILNGGFMKRIVLCCFLLCLILNIFAELKLSKADAFLQDTYLKYLKNKHSWIPPKQIAIEMVRDEPIFHLFLKCSLSRAELADAGIPTQSQAGDVFTARLTPSQLYNALNLDDIKHIESSQCLVELMDISTSSMTLTGTPGPIYVGTNADSVQNLPNPYNGAGVICAVIDGGINFQHLDFKKNGMTRVLNIWDQTSISLPHPLGYSYGREYTSSDIDNGTCTASTTAHGNSCIGIMAGNGVASPVGHDMAAMAPESDIICVKRTNYPETYTTYLQDGVAYVFEKATLYGKPAVVSISLGNNFGPHDGTTLSVQAIDNLCGPGKQVVVACGNSGTVKIHGEYVLQQNQDHIFNIITPNPISVTSPSIGVDFWYEGSDSLDIYITPPGGSEMPIVQSQTARTDTTSYGIIQVMNDIDDPSNGDNRLILFIEPNGSALAPGTWGIRIFGRVIQNGRIDGWSFSNVGTFTVASGGNDRYSISDLATGRKTVAAAGFIGGSQSSTGIIYLGSMGPTRDGRLKPDIAGNQYVTVPNYTGTDSYLNLSSGTSWSAPHVGGAIALLLQKQPLATPEMILDILHNSAVWDQYTQAQGNKPNYRIGYGKLNVARAFKETTPVSTLSTVVEGNDIRLNWTAVSGASSYNVYRSEQPDTGWVLIAPLQIGLLYVDLGAAGGKNYFYYITTNSGARTETKSCR